MADLHDCAVIATAGIAIDQKVTGNPGDRIWPPLSFPKIASVPPRRQHATFLEEIAAFYARPPDTSVKVAA
jgi:hypothetical protein